MGKFGSFIGGSSMGFPEADTPLKLLFSASTVSPDIIISPPPQNGFEHFTMYCVYFNFVVRFFVLFLTMWISGFCLNVLILALPLLCPALLSGQTQEGVCTLFD